MPRILIADDDTVLCESLATVLTASGYEVQTATTGAEAAGKLPVADVLVLDLMMPHGDGHAVLRRIAALRAAGQPTPRVLVLTALAPADRDGDLGLADRVLTKPVDIDVIRAELAAIMK